MCHPQASVSPSLFCGPLTSISVPALCVSLTLLEDGLQNTRGESAGRSSVHGQSPHPHLHLSAQAGERPGAGEARGHPSHHPFPAPGSAFIFRLWSLSPQPRPPWPVPRGALRAPHVSTTLPVAAIQDSPLHLGRSSPTPWRVVTVQGLGWWRATWRRGWWLRALAFVL